MAQYIWNEAKRLSNLAKHGLDFKDAYQAFDDEYFFYNFDARHIDDRWILIGRLQDKTIAIIAYAEPLPEVYRIISMRKAMKAERQRYMQEKELQMPETNDPMMLLIEKIFSGWKLEEDSEHEG